MENPQNAIELTEEQAAALLERSEVYAVLRARTEAQVLELRLTLNDEGLRLDGFRARLGAAHGVVILPGDELVCEGRRLLITRVLRPFDTAQGQDDGEKGQDEGSGDILRVLERAGPSTGSE